MSPFIYVKVLYPLFALKKLLLLQTLIIYMQTYYFCFKINYVLTTFLHIYEKIKFDLLKTFFLRPFISCTINSFYEKPNNKHIFRAQSFSGSSSVLLNKQTDRQAGRQADRQAYIYKHCIFNTIKL